MNKYGYWLESDTTEYVGEPMPWDEVIGYAQRVGERGNQAAPDAPKLIQILDVQDQTASAKLTAWWGTDYLLLARHDGRWMVRMVLWQGPLKDGTQ